MSSPASTWASATASSCSRPGSCTNASGREESSCWTCGRKRSTAPDTSPERSRHRSSASRRSRRRCRSAARSWPTAAAPTASTPTMPCACCARAACVRAGSTSVSPSGGGAGRPFWRGGRPGRGGGGTDFFRAGGLRPRPLRQPDFLDRIRTRAQPDARDHRRRRLRGGASRRVTTAPGRTGRDRRGQPLGPRADARMTAVRLGLRANAGQFALLVALNTLVGAMVGLERSVLPLVGKQDFGLRSTSAVLAFVVAFGAAKAITNLAAGALTDRLSRKWLLVAGWLAALPVPLLIAVAPSWWWIVAANILLGVNQGLAWSMTVVMKIDLAGPARRGLALGLNEAAGYLGVAGAAFATGALAATYAPRTVVWVSAAALVAAGVPRRA